jgi:hypothetical protein
VWTWHLFFAVRYKQESTKKHEKETCHQSIRVLVLDFVHMPDFRTFIDGVSGPHPGLNGNHACRPQEQAKNAPLL